MIAQVDPLCAVSAQGGRRIFGFVVKNNRRKRGAQTVAEPPSLRQKLQRRVLDLSVPEADDDPDLSLLLHVHGPIIRLAARSECPTPPRNQMQLTGVNSTHRMRGAGPLNALS